MADERTTNLVRATNAAELTRRCLSVSTRDPDQPVACTIGIALLCLGIGGIGLFVRPIRPAALPAPPDEPVPVLFVPPPPPAQTPAAAPGKEPEADQPTISAPQVVAVVPANVAVTFPLPTVGVVVPATPVALPIAKPIAGSVASTDATTLAIPSGVNTKGSFPKPDYPQEAQRRRIQGRVLLRAVIGADGRPSRLAVETSSGSMLLDHAALQGVQRWVWPPGEVQHLQIPVDFLLK